MLKNIASWTIKKKTLNENCTILKRNLFSNFSFFPESIQFDLLHLYEEGPQTSLTEAEYIYCSDNWLTEAATPNVTVKKNKRANWKMFCDIVIYLTFYLTPF